MSNGTEVNDGYGIVNGLNPLSTGDAALAPNLALLLVQIILIIILCRTLGWALVKIGQPPVVGEIIAGVLLGPTAFGRIPGFTENIFPEYGVSLLRLFSQIGLILFLFLVGRLQLETDVDLMKRYWKETFTMTFPGMAVPFAISTGVSVLLFRDYGDQSVPFTSFFLFIATVMAVTALSILSRILVELDIISTPLGAMAIASGVCNDCFGYLLLAIAAATASGGEKIFALYQLLCGVGLILLLWFAAKPALAYAVRRNDGELTTGIVAVSVLGALVSAWFTDIIGLHPMVGAFAFGVCCPHDFEFPEKVTERIETPTMTFLLPLYFVLSGLSTNLGLLTEGKMWGYIVLLIVATFISKAGCTAVSGRIVGLPWRQALCVGFLMQSKGVIELVILNVGLDLGVVSPTVFAMLVIVFILTTLTVRPLSDWIYLSRMLQATPSSPTLVDDKSCGASPDPEARGPTATDSPYPLALVLNTTNPSLSPFFTFLSLLSSTPSLAISFLHLRPLEVTRTDIVRAAHAERDRSGAVENRSSLVKVLRSYRALQNVPAAAASASTPEDLYEVANVLSSEHVRHVQAHIGALVRDRKPEDDLRRGMVVSAWLPGAQASSGAFFWGGGGTEEAETGSTHRSFPGRIFRETMLPSGVLVEPSSLIRDVRLPADVGAPRAKRRIVLPYFGGPDDRAALALLLKMCASEQVEGHVVQLFGEESSSDDGQPRPLPQSIPSHNRLAELVAAASPGSKPSILHHDSLHGQVTVFPSEATRQRSLNMLFDSAAPTAVDSHDHSTAVAAPSNITFTSVDLPKRGKQPISTALASVLPLLDGAQDFVLVGRGKLAQRGPEFRSDVDALDTSALGPHDRAELQDVGRVLGSVAQGLLIGGVRHCMLVVQAGQRD